MRMRSNPREEQMAPGSLRNVGHRGSLLGSVDVPVRSSTNSTARTEDLKVLKSKTVASLGHLR